jgi:predicted ribosomally synthesized peptide with nif11-like leader
MKGHAMDFENLDISPELRNKAKSCKSPEELLELAKREGYKLSEEELEAVSGGGWRSDFGDSREDVDSALAYADFVNGLVDGGEDY